MQHPLLQSSFVVFFALLAACERAPVPAQSQSPTPSPTEQRAGATAAQSEPAHAASAMGGMLATPPPGHAPSAPAPERAGPSFDPTRPRLAGLTWDAADPFVYRRPSSRMRAAEYAVAGPAGEALMTVFHFPGMGGTTQDNVARWTNQFEGAEAETETVQRDGFEITTVDTTGTFRDTMMTARQPNRPPPAAANQRLLGVIVVGPEGPVFFKLLGPVETVTAAESAFEHLVGSFRAAE